MTPHMKLDEKAVEAAARAQCRIASALDPDKIMPDGGPLWCYYVPGATAAIEAYLSAAHAPQGEVRGEPPAAVVDALNRHFATIGVTTKMPSVLAYEVWNIILSALTGSDPQ